MQMPYYINYEDAMFYMFIIIDSDNMIYLFGSSESNITIDSITEKDIINISSINTVGSKPYRYLKDKNILKINDIIQSKPNHRIDSDIYQKWLGIVRKIKLKSMIKLL